MDSCVSLDKYFVHLHAYLSYYIFGMVGSYDNHKKWDYHLPEILSSLRSSLHSALNTTPYQALFGQNMCLHGKNSKRLSCRVRANKIPTYKRRNKGESPKSS